MGNRPTDDLARTWRERSARYTLGSGGRPIAGRLALPPCSYTSAAFRCSSRVGRALSRRSRGPARCRPVTPEEYEHYLDLLDDEADGQHEELAARLRQAAGRPAPRRAPML